MRTNIIAAFILALVCTMSIVHADDMPNNSQMLTMMQRIYAKDMLTEAGRVRWHGELLTQTIDTNALVKINTYADGYTTTNKWNLIRPIDSVANKAKRLQAATNGVPAKLAAARIERVKNIELGVSNVTRVVEVNKHKAK